MRNVVLGDRVLEIATSTVTCAEAAQIAVLVSPTVALDHTIENLTATKFSIYARDMHFFYDKDLQEKELLVSLASGYQEFPAHPLANPIAVSKWVVQTKDNKYYLRDSVLAACVCCLTAGHKENPYQVACLLLWRLIPIAACLGMFAPL